MVTDNTKKRTAHKKGSLKEKVLQNEKRMQRKRNQLDNPTPEESLATENAHEEDKAESMPSRITRESAKQNHQFGINNGGKTKGVRVLATKRSLKFKETANSLRSKGTNIFSCICNICHSNFVFNQLILIVFCISIHRYFFH